MNIWTIGKTLRYAINRGRTTAPLAGAIVQLDDANRTKPGVTRFVGKVWNGITTSTVEVFATSKREAERMLRHFAGQQHATLEAA